MPKCIKCNNNMILDSTETINNSTIIRIYTCKNCTNIRQKQFINPKTKDIIGIINYKEF